jgi:hypothetical protein
MSRNEALLAGKRRRVTEIIRYSPRDRSAVLKPGRDEDRHHFNLA